MQINVRPFDAADEVGWVRCRVLSFLDSPYFDNVLVAKERYEHPAIELVAECNGNIVGLVDAEYEREPGTVAFELPGGSPGSGGPRVPGAVIHHLAVHPDYRARGVATRLLESALVELRANGIGFVEAWTRDQGPAFRWYEARGFRSVFHYLHVYVDGPGEHEGVMASQTPGLRPVYTFAHYNGPSIDAVKQRFERVYECHLFRRSV